MSELSGQDSNTIVDTLFNEQVDCGQRSDAWQSAALAALVGRGSLLCSFGGCSVAQRSALFDFLMAPRVMVFPSAGRSA